jgi:AraC family transcriptional regulator, positive regulator of tynA and feaB
MTANSAHIRLVGDHAQAHYAPGAATQLSQQNMQSRAVLEKPGRQRWSTGDVDTRHALQYWVDTVCKTFIEIDIDTPSRSQFHGQLERMELGPATLHTIEADAQSVHRTHTRIAHSRYGGGYILLQLRRGSMQLAQHGREVHLEAGDSVLVDCNVPYHLESVPTRSVAVRFEDHWLRNWIPSPQSVACRALRANETWSNTLCTALGNLDGEAADHLALPASVVAEQLAALLALAAGSQVHAYTPSEKLLNRIRHTIRDRYHEPTLDAGVVAAANGISKRYLHYLFAHASSTFGNELMQVRLESARRLLSDKRYAGLRVSEVAARCGFLEPSHFARRFRKTFGVVPTEFRSTL